MKPYQHYMYALLQNPEWMKSTIARYGRNDSIGMPELATAIDNLDSALRNKFDLDDANDSCESQKEFDVEGFCKDSDPPKAGP
jgi:hypothetical protein